MSANLSKSRAAGRIAAGGSLLLGTAGVGLFLAPHAGATGSTFTVLNNNDSGDGSLRKALLDANLNAGADTVVFDAAVTGTITLTSGQLPITESVTVLGPGSANLSVSYATGQIFYLYQAGVSNNVSISGLTLTGGAVAIHSWSTNLVLDDVVATGSTVGSVIQLDSNVPSLDQSLTIRNSVISEGDSGAAGAGIHVAFGFGQHAVLIDSTEIRDNRTSSSTGGLRVDEASAVLVSNSVISGNSAGTNNGGGAFFSDSVGDVQIISTTVDGNYSGNWGGGLYLNNQTVEIMNSTISNNTAVSGGGGVEFDNPDTVASISNTTITGNTAQGGGGVRMQGMASLTINQSTITQNTSTGTSYDGGGIQLYSQGQSSMTLILSGTIVSENTSVNSANADIDVKDGGATIVDADHSLLGDGTVDSVVTLVGSGNVRSNAPGLGALADNGGLTKTMALLTGSPAIDAGPNPVATFTGNGFDQRATPYLRVYGGQVDIGAFESQPTPTPSTTTTEPTSDPVAPAFTG